MIKFKFYLITSKVDINEDPDDSIFYSLVTSKKEAKECVDRLIFLSHRNHFFAWCNNRNIKLKHKDFPDKHLWDYYYKLVWPTEKNPYVIKKIKYDTKDIASLFRMMNNVPILGCSYETSMELDNYIKVNHITIDKK